jgi:DNA polymerase eta
VASFGLSPSFGGSLFLSLGYTSSRSKQVPFAFVQNATTDVVAAAGNKLWKEFFGTSDISRQEVNVTHLSLTFGGIESGEANQRGIEGFLAHSSEIRSPQKGKLKRMVEDDNDLDNVGRQFPSTSSDEETKGDAGSFKCKRCGKRVNLPESLTGPDIEDDIKREALNVLRVEHEDYHFAQDLSKLPDNSQARSQGRSSIKPPKPKKPKTSEPKGIAKFFSKQ